MRILFVNKYNYIKGGSETYLFGLKDRLEKEGHETAVFSMKDDKNFSSKYSDDFVNAIDYENSNMLIKIKNGMNLIYSFEAINKIEDVIKDFNPDVVHLNLIYHQITPSIINKINKLNIPIVLVVHDYKIICPNYKMYNDDKICNKCIGGNFISCTTNKCHKDSYIDSALLTIEAYTHKTLKSYNAVDEFIFPSNYIKEQFLKSYFSKRNKEKFTHIPNFVSSDYYDFKFKNQDIKKKRQILYYGRLSKEKGVDLLIEAVERLESKVTLKIVGLGPEERMLKEYVVNKKIENVEFCGFKSGDDLKEIISESMFVVLPSTWPEVFGLTNIESLALGTPIIGSNIGGISELITKEVGFLFEPGNLNDLVTQLNFALSLNDEEYIIMQNKCIENSKNYCIDDYYFSILKVYNQAIRKRGLKSGQLQ
ncbi:glycosyltransferase family 4 protein [Exiguobacterium alkaliphilum]|uniref:glycosyltransferase family 4 protein n=1 Tax=Exiguobacterium alkaliphilum TaxID=1428684 RepID=UPI000551F547|nr:glycosyltransferase family 4 protein [Exiguobacterium alkaliphilum]